MLLPIKKLLKVVKSCFSQFWPPNRLGSLLEASKSPWEHLRSILQASWKHFWSMLGAKCCQDALRLSRGAPNLLPRPPRCSPDASKTDFGTQNCLKMLPKCYQHGIQSIENRLAYILRKLASRVGESSILRNLRVQNLSKIDPKSHQNFDWKSMYPRCSQNAPKMLPRCSKVLPICSQDASNSHFGTHNCPKLIPRCFQDAPKVLPRCSQGVVCWAFVEQDAFMMP